MVKGPISKSTKSAGTNDIFKDLIAVLTPHVSKSCDFVPLT